MIESARHMANGSISAVINGAHVIVPDDMNNSHRQMLAEWEAGGGAIEPYTPPAPTNADVNAERDRRISAGTTLTVTGYGSIPLTGTTRDQTILNALRDQAKDMLAAGATGTINLRDANNTMHQLTPAQMVALVDAGRAWIAAVMQVSWDMKDGAAPFEAGIPSDYTDDSYWP